MMWLFVRAFVMSAANTDREHLYRGGWDVQTQDAFLLHHLANRCFDVLLGAPSALLGVTALE